MSLVDEATLNNVYELKHISVVFRTKLENIGKLHNTIHIFQPQNRDLGACETQLIMVDMLLSRYYGGLCIFSYQLLVFSH